MTAANVGEALRVRLISSLNFFLNPLSHLTHRHEMHDAHCISQNSKYVVFTFSYLPLFSLTQRRVWGRDSSCDHMTFILWQSYIYIVFNIVKELGNDFLMKIFYSNCNTQVYLLTVTVCSGGEAGLQAPLRGAVTITSATSIGGCKQ